MTGIMPLDGIVLETEVEDNELDQSSHNEDTDNTEILPISGEKPSEELSDTKILEIAAESLELTKEEENNELDGSYSTEVFDGAEIVFGYDH